MRMTRQHFQALATMTADIQSNPNFDADRFDTWIQNILIKNS